jgi:hypothetical protein
MSANTANTDGSGECPISAPLRAAHAVTGGAASAGVCAAPGTRRRARPRRQGARGAFAALICMLVFCAPTFAEDTKEVHGSGDAYAAPGVTLAWGILHGADEASTQVVLRVIADPQVYATVAAIGKNPFSGQERVLQPPTAPRGSIDVRVPRAQYAEFPRTELRFYAAGSAVTPALVVYYLGVPDTTPEFPDMSKLDAYLTDRSVRARGAAGGKAP